jgi:hypothetical protein
MEVCSALEHVGDTGTPRSLGALAVDLEVDLRRRSTERGVDGSEPAGRWWAADHEAARHVAAMIPLGRRPRGSASWNSKPDPLPSPMMGGRLNTKMVAGRDPAEAPASAVRECGEHRQALEPRARRTASSLATTISALLGSVEPVEQAEAAHREDALRPGPFTDDLLGLLDDGAACGSTDELRPAAGPRP